MLMERAEKSRTPRRLGWAEFAAPPSFDQYLEQLTAGATRLDLSCPMIGNIE
jgi:hypothetical protein